MNESLNFVTPLGDLAILEIKGADASKFLHSQLTQDVIGLDPGRASLAGYCTAKGRLLGTLVLWSGAQSETPVFYALIKADIAQAFIKRLSMFVLRAKVTLDITASKVMGAMVSNTGAPGNEQAPGLTGGPSKAATWSVSHLPSGTWIAAPSAQSSIGRWWHIPRSGAPDVASVSAAAPENRSAQPNSPDDTPDNIPDHDRWQAADIATGLPWIVAATQDLFIPQTLNLDLIDGISFTKGCYPGQEVVARSHYRGTVKRRMAYGQINEANFSNPAGLPGTDIYDAKRPGIPCGRVINAAQTRPTCLLLEVQLSDLDVADFRLASADGSPIEIQNLPYEIKTAAT